MYQFASFQRLNKGIIKKFIDGIPSDCNNYVHYTNLDHNVPSDENILKELLVQVPWNVINVWGGEEANNFYFQNVAKNLNRPKIINMEPLTGIVIIQRSYLKNNLNKYLKSYLYPFQKWVSNFAVLQQKDLLLMIQ